MRTEFTDYVPEVRALVNEHSSGALFKGSGPTLEEAMASLNVSKAKSFALSGVASVHVDAQLSDHPSGPDGGLAYPFP